MIPTIEWAQDHVRILDQTQLPHTVIYRDCTDHRMVARAIRELWVRGAPAIGVAAAMGAALGAGQLRARDRADFLAQLKAVCGDLRSARPTAVNLFWALDRVERTARESHAASVQALQRELIALARHMLEEDIAINQRMGQAGERVIPDGANVLTHCNTGSLATAGYGTALGVIRAAVEAGKRVHVFVDETRPVLQGARLTAWELMQDKIPCTLITDNMAASAMRDKNVQLCIVGADRIAANGDTANKIGTYGVAVLAKAHRIPFYVAAPVSTIDFSLASGTQIPIEQRDPDEVTTIPSGSGRAATAPKGVPVWNPAFDVTPAALITGIITERGVVRPGLLRRLQSGGEAPVRSVKRTSRAGRRSRQK
ncbi:MAG: S-methyl-5-thioribose-1-phosphate isomerase [Nitrospirota bacterium]